MSLINLATVRSLEEQWGYRDRSAAVPRQHLHRRRGALGGVRLGGQRHSARRGGVLGGPAERPLRRDQCRSGDRAARPRHSGSLRKAFGHKDLGIYLVARTDADLAVGDVLERPGGAAPRPAISKEAAPTAGPRAFICRGCYFIYDEVQGLPLAGVTPGTSFADLPAGWRCPDCGTDKSRFRPHMLDGSSRCTVAG